MKDLICFLICKHNNENNKIDNGWKLGGVKCEIKGRTSKSHLFVV